MVLVHARNEDRVAPAVLASHRAHDGVWTHQQLIEAYDAQPGRWHRSRISDDQIQLCSFEPATQRITWRAATLRTGSQADAGFVLDASITDAASSEWLWSQDFAGGPFCDVDERSLFFNQPFLGLIAQYADQEATRMTSRKGPFIVIATSVNPLILSAEDGRLLLGSTDEQPIDVGIWTINDRPKALDMDRAVLVATESANTHEIEFTLWEKTP